MKDVSSLLCLTMKKMAIVVESNLELRQVKVQVSAGSLFPLSVKARQWCQFVKTNEYVLELLSRLRVIKEIPYWKISNELYLSLS